MIPPSTLALLIAIAGAPQDAPDGVATPMTLPSTVERVVLYRDRAGITRTAGADLPRGTFDLRIEGLATSIDPATMQVRASGALRVLGVEYEERADGGAESSDVAVLEAQIEVLVRNAGELAQRRDLIAAQEKLIDDVGVRAANEASERGGTGRLDLGVVREQLRFIAEERARLLGERQVLDEQSLATEKDLAALRQRRENLIAQAGLTRTAIVSVTVTAPGPARLELTYLASEAAWEPVYNVRASSDGAEVTVECDAMITQHTGEDWDGVQLMLSTAEPTVAAVAPRLNPWYVDVADEQYAPIRSAPAVIEPSLEGALAGALSGGSEGEAEVVTFPLQRPVRIASNSRARQRTRMVEIRSRPRFTHVAVPLHGDAVYVHAELRNSSESQLPAGSASIFVGQNYIGQAPIGVVPAGGVFNVFFGTDPGVRVVRRMTDKRSAKTGLLGGGRRTSYEYRIEIENTTGKEVRLALWDRHPVSRTDEIRIELRDLSHPLATDEPYVSEQQPEGLLKWRLRVPPAAVGPNAMVVTYGVRIHRPKGVETTALPE